MFKIAPVVAATWMLFLNLWHTKSQRSGQVYHIVLPVVARGMTLQTLAIDLNLHLWIESILSVTFCRAVFTLAAQVRFSIPGME